MTENKTNLFFAKHTFVRGSKCVLFPQEWQQRWKMKFSEESREGVNENLSVAYKLPLDSPEAIEDFAWPLTLLQILKHVAQYDERTMMTALRCVSLSHNSLTYWDCGEKWTEIRGDRKGWWPVKFKRKKTKRVRGIFQEVRDRVWRHSRK